MSYTDLYSTPDSSLGMDARAMNSYYGGDYNIRIGIVREIVIPENPNGEKGDCLFIVDVRYRGRETTLEAKIRECMAPIGYDDRQNSSLVHVQNDTHENPRL